MINGGKWLYMIIHDYTCCHMPVNDISWCLMMNINTRNPPGNCQKSTRKSTMKIAGLPGFPIKNRGFSTSRGSLPQGSPVPGSPAICTNHQDVLEGARPSARPFLFPQPLLLWCPHQWISSQPGHVISPMVNLHCRRGPNDVLISSLSQPSLALAKAQPSKSKGNLFFSLPSLDSSRSKTFIDPQTWTRRWLQNYHGTVLAKLSLRSVNIATKLCSCWPRGIEW